MAVINLATSGRAASSRTKFGGMLLLSWFFNAQIAHEPVEALPVVIVMFPADEVANVALALSKVAQNSDRLHHGVI